MSYVKRVPWETRDDGGQGADGDLAEIRKAVDGLTEKAETRLTDSDKRLTEMRARLDAVEAAAKRPGIERAVDPKQAQERSDFEAYIRCGQKPLETPETRALRVSDDSAGGYLTPNQFLQEMLRNVVLFSPIRALARVAGSSTGTVVLPKRLSGLTATWRGELQPMSPTQEVYGDNEYNAKEVSCYVDVSNQLLEDSSFDIVAELAFDFAEEFGRAEGAAFVNGNGVLQPMGFMTDATVPYAPVVTAGAITGDDLISLFHAIPSPYRANGTWGMNSSTMAYIRKLKATNSAGAVVGGYLLDLAGSNGGITSTPTAVLMGRPVVEMPDMPNVGAGTFPIVFGDFMNAYRIFDRLALQVLRDPYSQSINGITRFLGRRRVAGGVAKSEAIVKLKLATS